MVHKTTKHVNEALRIAVMNQSILDNLEFEKEPHIMRCWDCQSIYHKKLEELDKKLGISHDYSLGQLKQHFKERTTLNGQKVR